MTILESLKLVTFDHVCQFGLSLWGVALSWVNLPSAALRSLTTGGLARLVSAPLRKKGLMTKELPEGPARQALGVIHFLHTKDSDAILLESAGQFALIDSSHVRLDGTDYAARVAEYVKRVARGKLEFVIGTHCHSDHIDGFGRLLIPDPEISIGKAYLKPYHGNQEFSYEKSWKNQEYYNNMVNACRARDVLLIHELNDQTLTLGHMHLTLLNGTKKPRGDENTNSTGILLDCGGKRAFLAGDINNIWGDETRLARKIGRVDLLKAGHHGFEGSNTIGYLAKLRPATVIFCNTNEWIFPTVRCRAACVSNSALLSTDDFPVGIAAVFGKDSLEYYSISGFQKPELSSPLTASKNKQD